MRQVDLQPLVEALREPMRRFVREARVRIALLVNGSGQILAQHGFTRSYEVVSVAALAAAAHAAARALAQLTGQARWTHLHHAGQELQLVLAPFHTPGEELILVAIFDEDSSLGLVQLYLERLAGEVGQLPQFQRVLAFTDAAGFERELEAGLRSFFASELGSG
ncbi:MAG: roadblock/LC7 domain-containing protein [Gemmatimonadetes bacterium]|nr:roadblock/LC7 domain-containing protein [Gemmatimonadota bacterium]